MYVIAFVLQLLNVWFSGLDALYVCSLLDLFLLVGHCCVGGKTYLKLPGCLASLRTFDVIVCYVFAVLFLL